MAIRKVSDLPQVGEEVIGNDENDQFGGALIELSYKVQDGDQTRFESRSMTVYEFVKCIQRLYLDDRYVQGGND